MEIKEYKCPNCGGTVKFDSSSQSMKCPYCDAEFTIAAIEEYQKQLQVPEKDNVKWDGKETAQEWEQKELDDLSTGSCPSCGAELLGDKNTASMVCPNCGNTQIVLRRLTGLLKPEYIISFKLDKKVAVEALKNFYKDKRLLPDSFKDENRVNSIQGVYLPFWLFDANAKGHVCYKGAKVKTWSDASYNYTKTDYYSIVRDGSLQFQKIPVDGSEKMDDDYMDAIEPFDYTLMTGFETAYLSGYLTEKYDVDAEKSKERAVKRIKGSVEAEFARSVIGYSSVTTQSSTISVEEGKVSYSLFPVWVLNTKYKNENYMFLMNGQSGRLIGKLPADPVKYWKYLALYAGIIGAVSTFLIQALRILL
ncbi:TFIIB-type zinc ribbon-containing protein [Treponema sp. R80B11-R83G3]